MRTDRTGPRVEENHEDENLWPLYGQAVVAASKQIVRNNLGLISAGVAFFAMLSVFPGLAALIAIFSLIADPGVVILQLQELRGLMPDEVYDIINAQVVGLVSTSSDTLGWAGILSVALALWSARAGVGALMLGLDAVYSTEGRATWRHYARALWLTASLIAVGIVALLMIVVTPVVLKFFPLGGTAGVVVEFLRWFVAVAVIFAGIGMLYRYGPNRRPHRTQFLTAGAVLAGFSWAGLSILFSYYVARFGNYNEVYGSIGAVIAMLIWLWITCFLVLLGAALNAELEARLPQFRAPAADGGADAPEEYEEYDAPPDTQDVPAPEEGAEAGNDSGNESVTLDVSR